MSIEQRTVKATVVLPTTAGRGLILPLSVQSILQQTLQDFELFIMGDGVDEPTRKVIHGLLAKDKRIRFFDHPKHERRGEPNRHAALQEAKGEVVSYLCDRDLMLPFHLERTYEQLQVYNIVSHSCLWVKEDRTLAHSFPQQPSERRPGGNNKLSCVGHRLDFYHQLPFGWRTTPEEYATDSYMWQQFYAHDHCQPFNSSFPTILYFKRPKAFSIEARKEELLWGLELTRQPFDAIREKALLNWAGSRRKEKEHLIGQIKSLQSELEEMKKKQSARRFKWF
ncbi:MAG: glycosyltransferase family 2 protein [Phaeodactylibacter sp.]|uniref:glycosyltransferase family 2 protein n=1 Tax=Phaeodactylibacter sp. TaxID=1940289 RepID=UPI0032ED1CCF